MASNAVSPFDTSDQIGEEEEDLFVAEAYLPETCRMKELHDNFIPIKELNTSHFPDQWQNDDFINNIKVLADLVVHIRLVGISSDRPTYYENSRSAFPHGRYKGNAKVVSYGSGYIYCEPYTDSPTTMKEDVCSCLSCVKSEKPESDRWYYFIATSKHVVYDLSEAKNSTFRCYFDTPEDNSEYFLYGVDYFPKKEPGYAKEEVCYVLCVTHNRTLMRKLNDALKKRTQVLNESITYGLRPIVLVSHPHGRSKMVTVGNFVHLTVPEGENFPAATPVKFGNRTSCNIPYKLISTIPWEEYFRAHGVDLNSMVTDDVEEYVPSKYFKPNTSLKFDDNSLIKPHFSTNKYGLFDVDLSVSIVEEHPKVQLHFLKISGNKHVKITPEADALFTVKLPANTTFTLPPKPEYAMRTTDSFFYNFPEGTTIKFGDSKEISLSPEIGFTDMDSVTLGYVYYKTMSCPGSSGGSVIVNLSGSFDVLPHGGALSGGVKTCYGRLPYVTPLIDNPRLPFSDELSMMACHSFVNDAVERVAGMVHSLILSCDNGDQAQENVFLTQFNEILRAYNENKNMRNPNVSEIGLD